MVGQKL